MEKRHEDFDELARKGPYTWGYGQLISDPYFNPEPASPQPQPSETPEKPADTPTKSSDPESAKP